MAFVKIFCWALIFLLRLRFPPGQSIADVLKKQLIREIGPGVLIECTLKIRIIDSLIGMKLQHLFSKL